MLSALGLDEAHEAAYRALVSLGAADVLDLARRLPLGEVATERALRHLERHGLAAQASGRPGRWVAAPPDVALGALLTRRRHELERAESSAALLAREYRARSSEPGVHELVEVVTGRAAVAQRFLQLQLGAVEEVCALVTDGPIAGADAEEGTRARAADRGVAYRVVVEHEVLTRPTGVRDVSAAFGRAEEVRVAERVPTRLLIADRSLAMVPLSEHADEPSALVVHDCALLESLYGLFATVWRHARPLHLGGPPHEPEGPSVPEVPDGTDLAILSLLLAGLTDASVAKQLDLGLRTVQRRVRGLMERAGVTTRLQLGWHARDHGWVGRPR
ncbi:helix-turn-helix domain-containing protein [Streptomyces sp. NPDC002490]|uniref:helix-turn-helix domain-containing protein n=1 Tax=Streptomyces sp. NPDC002490 TaxID=3154416 RepID=UPI00332362AC